MAITPWFTLSKTEVCCFNVKNIYIYIKNCAETSTFLGDF